MKSIEERVGDLEKSIRRYRAMVLGLVLALVAGIWAGPFLAWAWAEGKDREKIIRCQKLEVVDDQGKIRAILTVSKDAPVLALFDAQGKARVRLAEDKDGPGLELYDTREKLRTGLRVIKNAPVLTLYDGDGKPRAILGTNLYGEPRIGLFDDFRQVLFQQP